MTRLGARFAWIGLVVGMVAWTGLVHRDAVFTGRVHCYRDITTQWYSWNAGFFRAVVETGWPSWDPYTSFGRPILEDADRQSAYPLTWLSLLLPQAIYFKTFVLLHCAWAGIGLALLCKKWGCSARIAFVGGALWSASGPMLSIISSYHHFASVSWLPWVMLCLVRLLEERSIASALLLGASAGLQTLAGSGDICLMTAVVCLAYAAIVDGPALVRERRSLRLIGLALLAAVVSASLSAVQWLPTLSALGNSARALMTEEDRMFWSLHPLRMIDCVVPGLFLDLPLKREIRSVITESREPFLRWLYLGAASLPLAAYGLMTGERRLKWFARGGLALFMTLALGKNLPISSWLTSWPPFAWLRYPEKYVLPLSFLWAIGCVLGLDAYERAWNAKNDHRRNRTRVAATIGLIAAIVAAALAVETHALRALMNTSLGEGMIATTLSTARVKLAVVAFFMALAAICIWVRRRMTGSPTRAAAILGLILLADVAFWSGRFITLAPGILMRHQPEIVRAIQRDQGQYRAFYLTYPLEDLGRLVARGPAGWKREWSWYLGLIDALRPPIGARWEIGSSFDGIFTGLEPRALKTMSDLLNERWGSEVALKLLRMGNVRHVISLYDDEASHLEEVGRFESVFSKPIRLLRVPRPLPRVYLATRAIPAAESEALGILLDRKFDPERDVILPEGARIVEESPMARGSARLLWRRADALEIAIEADAPAYLVLVETYHPGWRAFLDGREVAVMRANLLFRAVRVPAGGHRVEFRYRPAAALIGVTLFLTATLFGAVFALLCWGKRALVKEDVS